MSAFDFSGNQELKYLPGGGPKWLFYHDPLLLVPVELQDCRGAEGEMTHFLVTDEKGNYFNWA